MADEYEAAPVTGRPDHWRYGVLRVCASPTSRNAAASHRRARSPRSGSRQRGRH